MSFLLNAKNGLTPLVDRREKLQRCHPGNSAEEMGQRMGTPLPESLPY